MHKKLKKQRGAKVTNQHPASRNRLSQRRRECKDFGFSVVIYLKDSFPKIEGEFGEAQGSYGQGVVVEIEMGLVQ